MILGNIEKFNGQGLVAFIDILGFSKEIIDNWGNTENNPLDKLLELKENLPIHSNEELNKSDSESKGKRICPCRVQTISDSVVVSFGFDENLFGNKGAINRHSQTRNKYKSRIDDRL